MNEQFFSLKRAHYGVLRVMRRPFASFGITPARFDMLYVLGRKSEYPCPQSALGRSLGVSASVVSRMLRRLEQLGLVSRTPVFRDHRQREVRLTDKGRACVREAHKRLWRAAQRLLEQAITLRTRWKKDNGWNKSPKRWDKVTGFLATCTLDSLLGGLRKAFFDSSRLYYPWHPDD